MSWAIEERQKFIAERLRVEGHIVRRNLVERFGITKPTASADLKRYMAAYSDMVYSSPNKRYEKVVK